MNVYHHTLAPTHPLTIPPFRTEIHQLNRVELIFYAEGLQKCFCKSKSILQISIFCELVWQLLVILLLEFYC